MAERIDPGRLEAILVSVGRHLVVGPADGERESAGTDTDPGRWGRRLLVAAVAILVVSAAVASIAPARRVVSGWLRAGNIDVEIDPDLTVPPELPAFIDDATPLDVDRLDEELGLAVPDVSASALGQPDAWWAPPEPGLVASWNEGDTSLWIVATEDTFPASLDKWARNPEMVTSLPDLGNGGYAVDGIHIFETEYRTVAANSVVAWTAGDLTFRLDSTMPVDELVDVAEAIAGD